jgi:hypothetical protein
MKKLFLCLLFVPRLLLGATLNTDGSPADVQNKLKAAQAGDTVVIPAGNFNWTAGVSAAVQPNVTLKGAGTSTTGGGDQSVITDNFNAAPALLNIGVPATGVFRMTGVTVQSGATNVYKDNGTINFNGPGIIRIDHCHIKSTNHTNYKTVRLGTGVFGVMHDCVLDFSGLSGSIYLYNGRFDGASGDYQGNLEWALPTDFGGPDYFFVEDNIINGGFGARAYDGFTGAKVVVRFNTMDKCAVGETHATGHGPDDRGLRSQEGYGNKITSDLVEPGFCAIDIKNGTTLVWGNSWDSAFKSVYHIRVTRSDNSTYGQAPTPNGWGYAGTQFNGVGSNWDGGTALGSDTVTGYPCLDQPGRGKGDLLKGYLPNKVNATTGTIRWPNQAQEPVYMWANVGSNRPGWGGSEYSNASGGRVAANRDYYPQASGVQTSPTSPFNGTSGTGWGTLANRPTSCTPGVAYWASDQGSWNKSTSNPYGVQQNGADGVLYKCTAANTWTQYYTPYDYPHPLRSGEPPSPTPSPTPPGPTPAPTATPTPGPTPPPSGNESPDCTKSRSVSDAIGAAWTLSTAAGSGNTLRNGVHVGDGAGELYKYVDHQVFLFNGTSWWKWTGSAWQNIGAEPTCGAPTPTPTPQPTPTPPPGGGAHRHSVDDIDGLQSQRLFAQPTPAPAPTSGGAHRHSVDDIDGLR